MADPGGKPSFVVPAGEWRRRPLLSWGLRVLIFAVPVGFSFGVALLLSRMLPRAHSPWAAALWIGTAAVGSLLTLVLFERAARRLLPLAALLNVSLLFPDKAPARFAVARRTGTPRELRERMEAARASGQVDRAQDLATVIELVLALNVHDRASRGHSERVRVFTDLLTAELKLPEADRARLRWAALLHDVGKLEVPASLLNKPSAPDEEEWVVLRRHPEDGARMVAPLLPWLGEWGAAVVQHHERYDGTGYPRRLKAHEISLAARIVSVADVYEVMTAPRPYKRPMSVVASRQELIRVAGTQLDPAIVRAFLNISSGNLWRTIGIGAWIAQIPTLGGLWSGLGSWLGTGVATIGAIGVIAAGGILGGLGPALPHGGFGIVPPTPVIVGGQQSTIPSPPNASGSPGVSATPTGAPSRPPATPTATSLPTSRPTSAATPTAAPTSTPADPCPLCTNTSTTCTTYCRNAILAACKNYCEGNDNQICNSHCYGNNNPLCNSYCVGPNNPKCVSNCQASITLAAITTTYGAPSRSTLMARTSLAAPNVGAHIPDHREVAALRFA
ncbi:MAG TPA: HD domain-containing phosphohydrolase [Candidatus Saccharimonadales bacterium]|nr:HD domain-containing phosphohydrolase [Candidatus Saccharimonadales bacterium]